MSGTLRRGVLERVALWRHASRHKARRSACRVRCEARADHLRPARRPAGETPHARAGIGPTRPQHGCRGHVSAQRLFGSGPQGLARAACARRRRVPLSPPSHWHPGCSRAHGHGNLDLDPNRPWSLVQTVHLGALAPWNPWAERPEPTHAGRSCRPRKRSGWTRSVRQGRARTLVRTTGMGEGRMPAASSLTTSSGCSLASHTSCAATIHLLTMGH